MDRVKREEVYVWRECRGRMYGEKVGEVGGGIFQGNCDRYYKEFIYLFHKK